MFKVSILMVLALLCSGCATSTSNASLAVKTPTKAPKSVKYAFNQGCQMLSNGYMVCPKSR